MKCKFFIGGYVFLDIRTRIVYSHFNKKILDPQRIKNL